MAARAAQPHPRGRPDPSPTPFAADMPAIAPGPVAASSRGRRRDRELATLRVMIEMYCRVHHAGKPLCGECAELAVYAARRLARCVFGAAKPTCANCTVHCYGVDMREHARAVMRHAGPRMLLRHPLLGIAHLIDGRRPAPALPGRPARTAARRTDAGNATG
jgi:hypothetical protein